MKSDLAVLEEERDVVSEVIVERINCHGKEVNPAKTAPDERNVSFILVNPMYS